MAVSLVTSAIAALSGYSGGIPTLTAGSANFAVVAAFFNASSTS
jgi:uncharacterized membrane protein